MIDVDCRDILPIMRDLLVYVSDQVGAIPTIKSHGFALESFDDARIDPLLVVNSIREYLDSIGDGKKYAVVARNETVTVNSISGEPMKNKSTANTDDSGLFSCSHCGYVTRFETELNTHRVIHYL